MLLIYLTVAARDSMEHVIYLKYRNKSNYLRTCIKLKLNVLFAYSSIKIFSRYTWQLIYIYKYYIMKKFGHFYFQRLHGMRRAPVRGGYIISVVL